MQKKRVQVGQSGACPRLRGDPGEISTAVLSPTWMDLPLGSTMHSVPWVVYSKLQEAGSPGDLSHRNRCEDFSVVESLEM